eukprot:s5234_g3.t1
MWPKAKARAKGPKAKDPRKGKARTKASRKIPKARASHSRVAKAMQLHPPKGGSKSQGKGTDAANQCNYCGKFGHWKRDCRKFQADKANGQVRQVDGDSSQHAASSPGGSSAAQHSPSATSYKSAGNVNRVAFNDSTVIIEDLTEFSQCGSSLHGSLRMVCACSSKFAQFDMACTDNDDSWTFAPAFEDEPIQVQHVRMMSFSGETASEIILDSGADTSALPLAYGDVGESCMHEIGAQDFIDAQGGKLDIRDTRLATVDLGNGVVLRERFIIANISSPLLALGHIVRAGWELNHMADGVYLVKNDKAISVNFKRNSLCVQGCIWMVSEDDVFSPKASRVEPSPAAIRAIHLEPVLRKLLPGEIYDPESVIEVLTLAHVHCVASEDLGFRFIEGEQRPFFDDDVPEEPGPPQPVIEEPAAVPEAEPLDEDRVVPYQDESSVTVDGIVFTAGCTALGLSKRGSKKDCMKRMVEVVKTRELMEAQAVEAKLKQDVERHAIPQSKPVAPSDAELGHSVISFDFFYCNRMKDESDKLTVLIVSDRDTGLCAAMPTLQKGGKSLNYLVTEMCRFVVQCGHTAVGLRCDSEPSTLALLEAVKKALAGLRIIVFPEPAPTGDHRANGAAEAMVATIRNKANLLVSQIEEATGCKEPIFGCLHPVYAWAIIHSSWIHNRYVVKQTMTGFERATGRHYTGKVAFFGESVLGYLRTSQKGLPQWRRAIWLSKSATNDCHILGTEKGLFVTRSAPPVGIAIGDFKLDDTDALAVRKYARAHPFEDVDPKALSTEAGVTDADASLADGQQSQQADLPSSSTPFGGDSNMAHGESAPVTPLGHGEKHDTEHDQEGSAAKKSHVETSAEHGNVVPQTPVEGVELLDDTPFEQMASPQKAGRHDEKQGGVNLLWCIRNIECLDFGASATLSVWTLNLMFLCSVTMWIL